MAARIPTLLLAGLFAVACATDEPPQEQPMVDTSADEAAIEQIRADYVAHYNQHHASVVADLFADSAFALWADGTVATGKPAILAGLELDMAGTPTLGLESTGLMVLGDHAVGKGIWTVTATPPDGAAPMTLAGAYLTHFEKLDGVWKINAVTTNFNAPPPDGVMQPWEGEAPPDEGTMGALVDAWEAAFAAGDWAALAQLYTSDASVSFTEAPPLEGRAALEARFGERFTGTTSQSAEIHDVGTREIAPGWALDGGWYTVSRAAPDGSITQTGTYMHLLQQQPDGSWKIHWAVSNGRPTPAT